MSSLRHGCAAVAPPFHAAIAPPAHAAVALCCCHAAVVPHIRATVTPRACAAVAPSLYCRRHSSFSALSYTSSFSQSRSQKLGD
ncbi:hypothetical protein S245_030553 [Arachis hypogaea]|nr:uncharacterized protein DS421_9g275080 [Arachis hypogaea]